MFRPTRTCVLKTMALAICLTAFVVRGHYREHPDEATRPPQIVQQPEFTEIPIGEDGALYVHAIGAGTLEYQWFHNGSAIDGATDSKFAIANASREQAGFYKVEVSSPFGTAESELVRVRVDLEERLRAVERHVSGDQENVSTIEYYDGYFYAASREGKIWRSADGYDWEALENSPGAILNLIGGEDRLLALMPEGAIAWTNDLENWESILIDPESRNVVAVVHSRGVFAALVNTINTTRLYTSADGLNWQLQHEFAEGAGSNFLVETNGFIAAGRSSVHASEIASSSNGSDWTIAINESITGIRKAHSFDESALLVSRDGSFFSTDGISWEYFGDLNSIVEEFDKTLERDGVYYGLSKQYENVRWVGYRWRIELYRSTNLRDWSRIDSTTLTLLGDDRVTFETGNGVLMYGPIEGTIYPIEDFERFQKIDPLLGFRDFQSNNRISYLCDRFVITYYDSTPFVGGKHRLTQSRSGKSRLEISENRSEGLQSLAYGNGVFATGQTVGSELDIMRSSLFQVSFEPKRLLFGNGVFVGISADDIWYSEDGDVWEKAGGGFLDQKLFFAGGRFFSQGESGTIFVSSDGSEWIPQSVLDPTSGEPLRFGDIGFLNDRYIGIDDTPGFRVYESLNGLSWDRIDVDFSPILSQWGYDDELVDIEVEYTDMAFGEDAMYFLFGGFFAITSDFINWELIPYEAGNSLLEEVAYGADTLLAISSVGRIVQVDTTISVPPQAIFRNRNTISTTPNAKVNLLVDAFDVDGDIEKVAFFVDGKKSREVIHPPFDWEWAAPKTGIFDLSVVAEDNSGIKTVDGVTAKVSQNIGVGQFDQVGPPSVVDVATLHDSAFALGSNGSIYRSDDLYTWQLVFAPPFGAPSSLDSTSSLLYAPTSDGVYVCHDAKNWVHLTEEMPRSYAKIGDWIWSGYSTNRESFLEISHDLYNWSSVKVSPEADVRFFDLVGHFQGGLWIELTVSTSHDPYVVDAWGTATRIDLPQGIAPQYASSADGYNYVWTWPNGTSGAALYQSTSLENWSFVNTPEVGTVSRFEKVGDLFVLETFSVFPRLPFNYISSDGFLSWNETGDFGPVVHRDGIYVGILNAEIVYSEDGDNWVNTPESVNVGMEGDVVSTSAGFLALDSVGGMHASTNGIEWTAVNRPGFGNGIVDIAYDGTLYVALSETNLYTSIEGSEWEISTKPETMKNSITARDELFVVNGENGTVFISVDGVTWEMNPVNEGIDDVFAVEYLPEVDRFILETHTEGIWTSSDGIDWISNEGVGGGQFKFEGERLFLCYNGVYSTKNGVDFERIPHLVDNADIHFANGVYLSPVFLESEMKNALLRSLDGVEWDIVDSPDPGGMLTVIDTGFYLINPGTGEDLFSANGLDWVPTMLEFPQNRSVVVGGKRWYLDWNPQGESGTSETSLYTITHADLSLEKIQLPFGTSESEDSLSIRVSVRNNGPEQISLRETTIEARFSEGEEWMGSHNRLIGRKTLPDWDLEPEETKETVLVFEIPEATAAERTSIQLQLNPDRSPAEIDASNNYAWLRLLPGPKVSIRDLSDDTVTVEWSREGGYVKRFEYSYDLENWFLLDAPEESAESGAYSETVDPDREKFYRVRAE